MQKLSIDDILKSVEPSSPEDSLSFEEFDVISNSFDCIDVIMEMNDYNQEFTTYSAANSVKVQTEADIGAFAKKMGASFVNFMKKIFAVIKQFLKMIGFLVARPFVFIFKAFKEKSLSKALQQSKDDVKAFFEDQNAFYEKFSFTENTETPDDFQKSCEDYYEYMDTYYENLQQIIDKAGEITRDNIRKATNGQSDVIDGILQKGEESHAFADAAKSMKTLRETLVTSSKDNVINVDFSKIEKADTHNPYTQYIPGMPMGQGPSFENTLHFAHLVDTDKDRNSIHRKHLDELYKEFEILEKQLTGPVFETLPQSEQEAVKFMLDTMRMGVSMMSYKAAQHAQDLTCVISNTTQVLKATGYKFNDAARRGLMYANDEIYGYVG